MEDIIASRSHEDLQAIVRYAYNQLRCEEFMRSYSTQSLLKKYHREIGMHKIPTLQWLLEQDLDLFFPVQETLIHCYNYQHCWYAINPKYVDEHECNYYSAIAPDEYFYCDACYEKHQCFRPKDIKRKEAQAIWEKMQIH